MNPLLDFSGLPRFDAFRPEHVTPAIDGLLATNRATLERERERQDKRVPTSAARMVVQDEPEFGPSAFSVTMGNSVQTYVLKGDTMIMLGIQMLAGEPARNKAFVRRVIAAS